MQQLGPFLSILVTRLLDLPKKKTMLGGVVEKSKGYRVTAYDEFENELDYTETIKPNSKSQSGEEPAGGSQHDLRYEPQIIVAPWRGIMDLQTDTQVIYVEVHHKGTTRGQEEDFIGRCKIHRFDPRSQQVWPYQLEKQSGSSAHCGIELKLTEGLRPPGPVSPMMGTPGDSSMMGMPTGPMLPPTAGAPFGSHPSQAAFGTSFGGAFGRLPGMPSVSAVLEFDRLGDIPKPTKTHAKFHKLLITVVAQEAPKAKPPSKGVCGPDEDDAEKQTKPKEKELQNVGPFTVHQQQADEKLQDADCLNARVFVQNVLHFGGQAGEGTMYLSIRASYVDDVKVSNGSVELVGSTAPIKISWERRTKQVYKILQMDPETKSITEKSIGYICLSHHLMTDAETAKSGIMKSGVTTSVGPSSAQKSEDTGPEPCKSRWPAPGDRVYRSDGQRYVSSYGWELAPGALAVVVDVDRDGDFKLRNPEGNASKWIFRENFMYAKEGPEVGRRPINGRTGNFPKGSPEEAYEQAAINCDAQNRALLQRVKIHDRTSHSNDPRVENINGYRHWDSLDTLFSSMGPNPMTVSDEVGASVARCYKQTTSVAEEINRLLPPAFGPADAMLNGEMVKMMFKDDPTKVETMLRPVICKDPNEIAMCQDMAWAPDPPVYSPIRNLRQDDLETLRLACYHPTQNASLLFPDVNPEYRITEDIWGVSHSLKASRSLQVDKPWWHRQPRVKDDCIMA
jgi:hypothetical protein